MTVKNYNGESEPQFIGTFDFAYDGSGQVSEITKTLPMADGTALETAVYHYSYQDGKLTTYGINSESLTVSYDGDGSLLNLGFGSNLEFYGSGLLKKDSYGTEFVYSGANPTGTPGQPSLYAYGSIPNPFLNHDNRFRIVFEN